MLKKRSIKIAGHSTSITLENEFWRWIENISKARKLSTNELITEVDSLRDKEQNLSSALRVFILRELAKIINNGQIATHFKGNNYRIIGEALNVHTEKMMTVYQPLYPNQYPLFVRNSSEFNDTLTRDGKTYKRFQIVKSK